MTGFWLVGCNGASFESGAKATAAAPASPAQPVAAPVIGSTGSVVSLPNTANATGAVAGGGSGATAAGTPTGAVGAGTVGLGTSAATGTPGSFTSPVVDKIPAATAAMYADTTKKLYSIDPTTGQSTLIAAFNQSGSVAKTDILDIAIDGKGKMFAVDDTTLYAVNPTTAELTAIMTINIDTLDGLTVLSDGSIVVAGFGGVVVVDGVTHAQKTLVAPSQYQTSGDIIALPDHMLYWTVFGDNGDNLLRVDPSSGQYTVVGNIGVADVFGLGYASGKLYGFADDGAIFTISTITGQKSVGVQPSGGPAWAGATTNPVVW